MSFAALLLLVGVVVAATVSLGQEVFPADDVSAWSAAEDVQGADRQGGGGEACYGRRCSVAPDCCKGSVCVDVDGVSGTCLPVYGKKEGEGCAADSDCEAGLVCGDSRDAQRPKACRFAGGNLQKKAYNDECVTSSECGRGLCCQVLRRHRMASRKACHYFVDPLSCVGPLETDLKPLHFLPNPFFKARMG